MVSDRLVLACQSIADRLKRDCRVWKMLWTISFALTTMKSGRNLWYYCFSAMLLITWWHIFLVQNFADWFIWFVLINFQQSLLTFDTIGQVWIPFFILICAKLRRLIYRRRCTTVSLCRFCFRNFYGCIIDDTDFRYINLGNC